MMSRQRSFRELNKHHVCRDCMILLVVSDECKNKFGISIQVSEGFHLSGLQQPIHDSLCSSIRSNVLKQGTFSSTRSSPKAVTEGHVKRSVQKWLPPTKWSKSPSYQSASAANTNLPQRPPLSDHASEVRPSIRRQTEQQNKRRMSEQVQAEDVRNKPRRISGTRRGGRQAQAEDTQVRHIFEVIRIHYYHFLTAISTKGHCKLSLVLSHVCLLFPIFKLPSDIISFILDCLVIRNPVEDHANTI